MGQCEANNHAWGQLQILLVCVDGAKEMQTQCAVDCKDDDNDGIEAFW